jgi:medium-chain acyl-[acyl-carrier-protein] hydrolase
MSHWLTNSIPKHASIRLFCFHYAGGGASSFSSWRKLFTDDIVVCPIQLPGRESRFREPRITDFQALIDELYSQLLPHLQQPYIFYGHSLGGLIAYALTHKLNEAKLNLPLILFIGAHRAPHIPYPFPFSNGMDLTEIKKFLGKFQGIPESILHNEEWMKVLLPLIRDDLLLCESYKHTFSSPLPCPIHAFGGDFDPMVSPFEIYAWRKHTSAEFKTYFFPEGHFFLKSQQSALIDAIQLAIQVKLEQNYCLLPNAL